MKIMFTFLIAFSYKAQAQSFNYERSWGTYLGGTITFINNMFENSSGELQVFATTYDNNSTQIVPHSYYNQFVINSSNFYNTGYTPYKENNFAVKLSPSGAVIKAEYSIYSTITTAKILPTYLDDQQNRYDINSHITSFPTLNYPTWIQNNQDTNDCILSKYNASNNLLWKTYIPHHKDYKSLVKTDSDGNIYVSGTTNWQNIGDAGTFTPNFTNVSSNGLLLSNSFLIKLNSQGQKIWSTYIPAKSVVSFDIYNNNIYLVTNEDLDSSVTNLATIGTFQQQKSVNAILKINTLNGQRIWGTYYGNPSNFSHGKIKSIRVNASGIYVLGNTSNPGGYYSEEGSHKSSTIDGFDLFLGKFTETGNRDWGTYIGSDQPEINSIYYNIEYDLSPFDIRGDKILVGGHSLGNQNIATPGSFLDTKPSASNGGADLFFSMFNSLGTEIFTSYYGSAWLGNNTPANFVEVINCKFSTTSDSFYIYGFANRYSGYTTANAHQTTISEYQTNGFGGNGYITKFNTLPLSTLESTKSNDITLFNNPNNGNFSIRGKKLSKDNQSIKITDVSGKLIYSQNLKNDIQTDFKLNGFLENGNYLLNIYSSNKLIKNFKLIIKK